LAKLATEISAPILAVPAIDMLDANRPKARKLKLEPTSNCSNTDILLPKRTKERTDKDEPISACSKADNPLLHFNHPRTETAEPPRANARMEKLLPKCM
jgi:hypothetical protein